MVDVVEVKHIRDHILWLRFEDGTEGEINLAGELRGPVFEPLRSPDYFAHVSVNPEIGTITWPNGADFAPEFLYNKVHVAV
jgi:hypothetical protein